MNVFDLIAKEQQRQNENIELIASENFVSENVLKAVGSCLTNKYAEGYPVNRTSGSRGRYYGGCEIVNEIETVCKRKMILTLTDAEPIGPKLCPELMIVAPTTGSTLANLRHGIYDTPVTLAAKSHLRNDRPLLIALATNDALSGNFENLAALYNRNNYYFVPLRQDDPERKPFSLVCDFERIPAAVDAAAAGKQLLPLFEG